MSRPSFPGPFRLLRLGSGFLLCAVATAILLAFGQGLAAAGVGIGFGLYALNLFFLYEAARGLLSRADSGPRFLAAAASVGRLLFLGMMLALVFFFLGRAALLGACGGLFLSQVNLHLQGRQPKGAI